MAATRSSVSWLSEQTIASRSSPMFVYLQVVVSSPLPNTMTMGSSLSWTGQFRFVAVDSRSRMASAPVSSRASNCFFSSQPLCFLLALTVACRNFLACLNACFAAAICSSAVVVLFVFELAGVFAPG